MDATRPQRRALSITAFGLVSRLTQGCRGRFPYHIFRKRSKDQAYNQKIVGVFRDATICAAFIVILDRERVVETS
jgi:hypothetical protein